MVARILKVLFFAIVVKPVVFIVLGLNIRNRENLPVHGPAIIAANHNSHLDTLVLMSLYPLSVIHKLRPVAAADYFMTKRWLAWFALNIIGIIPLKRGNASSRHELFSGCNEALNHGDILILFPEGSRGVPEQLAEPKRGIYYLIKDYQGMPIIPVLMHGLGRSLPKGEALLVPFNCDVIIGERLPDASNAKELLDNLSHRYQELYKYCLTCNTLE